MEILQYLTKIDSECESHRTSQTYLSEEEREIFHKDVNLNLGCYTKSIEHFYLKMEIYTSSCGCTTLEEYIKTSPPRIDNVKKISVFSCLDG